VREAALQALRCPLDGLPLERADRSVRCADGHTTDLAVQGYLNLLGGPPPQHADTTEMLASRAAVHAAGCFAPLTEALVEQVAPTLASAPAPLVLDVGSGPGLYLAAVLEAEASAEGLALDVSKHAARRAARCHARASAVVADVWRPLPLADGVASVVLDVFAPRNPEEFARVLRPGGCLLVVVPGPAHLQPLPTELGLLGVGGDKDRQLDAMTTPQLAAEDRAHLRWVRELPLEVVVDLVMMGPSAHHQQRSDLEARVRSLVPPVVVTFDVTVARWRRTSVA
jgi:23S rRNA (guanine745-N1)-methyltransferase